MQLALGLVSFGQICNLARPVRKLNPENSVHGTCLTSNNISMHLARGTVTFGSNIQLGAASNKEHSFVQGD